jgi:hypothetical protein
VSSFEATRCQPAYKPTLQDEEQYNNGQDYDYAGRARQTPVRAEVAPEGPKAGNDRLEVVVLDKGDGE